MSGTQRRAKRPVRSYIVICQQWIGSPSTGYGTAYNWDREIFKTRAAAKRHGFKERGSDDFNIGVLEGDRLVSFDWMDEPIDHDLTEIAEYIGLET